MWSEKDAITTPQSRLGAYFNNKINDIAIDS